MHSVCTRCRFLLCTYHRFHVQGMCFFCVWDLKSQPCWARPQISPPAFQATRKQSLPQDQKQTDGNPTTQLGKRSKTRKKNKRNIKKLNLCIYLLDLFILGSPTPQLLFTDWGCIVRLCMLFPKALYTLWITSSFRHGLDQSTMVQIPNLWWKNIDRRAKQLHPLYSARWITPFWGNGAHPNLGDLQVVFGIGCGDRCGPHPLKWFFFGSYWADKIN